MHGKNILIALLAAFLAGIIITALYFYLGPYGRISEESQQLRGEIKIRRASESKIKEEISQLKATLQEMKAELAEKTRLVEDLEAKLEGFTKGISRRPSGQEMRTVAVTESGPGRGNHMVIRRAAIALRVETREPIGVSQRVSVRQHRVYCWMHIINGKGEKIAKTELPVGSNSWRTWAYITLRPDMIGPAQAEILDENDKFLKTLPFEITE